MQLSNLKICIYCWLSRCHKSFRFAKVSLILLGCVKLVERGSRVQGDIPPVPPLTIKSFKKAKVWPIVNQEPF